MSKHDQAVVLIESINRLRVIREQLHALELHGAADAAARAMADLRRMLQLVQEEGGLGLIDLPLEAIV